MELTNKLVCITGTLTYERKQIVNLLRMVGADESKNCTKATDYLVVGMDPGRPKVENAEKYGTVILTEEELMNALRQDKRTASVLGKMAVPDICRPTGNELRESGNDRRQKLEAQIATLEHRIERLTADNKKYSAYIAALVEHIGPSAHEVMMEVDRSTRVAS